MKPVDVGSTELMHAVLDGTATPAQAAALQAVLANDAEASTRFTQLQQVFTGLQALPMAAPPADLMHQVMARLPEPAENIMFSRQLSSASNVVINKTGRFSVASRPIQAVFDRIVDLIIKPGSDIMSNQEQKSNTKRNVVLGGGLAVAAIAIVAMNLSVFPAAEKASAVGTVAPAQRYVAAQPTAADVAVAAPSTGGSTAAVASEQINAVGQASNVRAEQASNMMVGQAANLKAEQASNMMVGQAANLKAEQASNLAAGQAANLKAELAANKMAEQAANKAAQAAANRAAGRVAQ